MKILINSATRWATLSLVGLVVAGAAMLPSHSQAATSIVDSRHNLGTTTSAITDRNRTDATDEVCVFCHTPHGAVAGPPLWNKALPTGPYTVYSTSNSSTIDGELANGGGSAAVGSVSIACLSCHDGTAAMDSVINAPGSGGYTPTTGARMTGTWTARSSGGTPVIPGTGILGAGIANLGTDLSNDHPIGIQYCGGGHTTSGGVGTCVDTDFVAPVAQNIGGENVFWVNTSVGTASREKTDMILYNRSFTVAGAGPSVECASCHDPHRADTSTFLRISNAGSAVCLACHVK